MNYCPGIFIFTDYLNDWTERITCICSALEMNKLLVNICVGFCVVNPNLGNRY